MSNVLVNPATNTTNVLVNPATNRPDGTDADYFAMKSVYPGVTNGTMHLTNGALALVSGRVHEQVFVSVLAYELGRHNSNDDLRQHISSALIEFSLIAKTGWHTVSPV
jgi:diacylglycerol O-acyltransferase